MFEAALKILQKIEEYGYKAYIVGGFVRDYLLGNKSPDVDITTNATPKDIKNIFPNSFVPTELYGSITVISDKIRFEITTFRKEYSYTHNRRPLEIEYINSLYDDLVRRDFTINTFCIDSSGKVIDLLNVRSDLDNKIIKTVHNSKLSFTEDSLRILRAIRFATTLNFDIDIDTKNAIFECKKYLSNISYSRKKSELDKIFMSNNAKYGVELLKKFGLDKELEIYNIDNIILSGDLVGIWASLDVSDMYPFTKSEKELISKTKELMRLDVYNPVNLYHYGAYISSQAAVNNGLDKNDVINSYNSLPIKTRSDILISSSEIIGLFNKKPGRFISDVYNDIEEKILLGELNNNLDDLTDYIKRNYLYEK